MRADQSPALALRRLEATLATLAVGPGAPAIQIHGGPDLPAGDPAPQPLVTIELLTPPGAIVAGFLVLHPASVDGDLILRSGVATWARFVDGAGDWVLDVDVGLENSDAVVWLESLTLRAGGRCPLRSAAIA